ncbi:hypothetical protein [Enterococcus sp. LJL90]
MAGFYPGLSGILVKSLIEEYAEINKIELFLLQNKNANVGLTGIHDMLKIISRPLSSGERGFTNISQENFDGKNYKLREINHDEAQLLQKKLSINKLSYYTSWNNSFFNLAINFVIKNNLTESLIKIFRKFNLNLDNQSSDETIYLKVRGTVEGKSYNYSHEIVMKLHSDYEMTAYFAAFMADYLSEIIGMKGVLFPFDLINSNEIDVSSIDSRNEVFQS